MDDPNEPRPLDDRPPLLGWPAIYLLVVGALAVQVALYALLTAAYR
jgi:hypothetical protein